MTKELKVTINGLSDAIQDIIKDYVEEDVKPIIKEEMNKVVRLTKKELKRTSPSNPNTHKKKYKDSWRHKTEKGRLGDKVIIYNTQGQLTHLLENGHYKYNQHGGPYSGRSKSIPHIKPAQEMAEKQLIENIINRLENL